MATNIERFQDTLAGRIDITKYSDYNKLLRVTARVTKLDETEKNELEHPLTNEECLHVLEQCAKDKCLLLTNTTL